MKSRIQHDIKIMQANGYEELKEIKILYFFDLQSNATLTYKTFRQTPVKLAHIIQLLHITVSYGYVHRKNLHKHPYSTKVVPIMFGLQFRKLCVCASPGTTVIPAVLFRSDQPK